MWKSKTVGLVLDRGVVVEGRIGGAETEGVVEQIGGGEGEASDGVVGARDIGMGTPAGERSAILERAARRIGEAVESKGVVELRAGVFCCERF
jgi:hypothetical protein